MNKTTVYRIRDTRSGLFAPGGLPGMHRKEIRWRKKGKVWTSYGAVKCHLQQYAKHAATVDFVVPVNLGPWSSYAEVCADYLARVEVVFYDVVETESQSVGGLAVPTVKVDNEV